MNPTPSPDRSAPALTGRLRPLTGRLRPLLQRADAYTLWAFNAPAHLGGPSDRVTR